ncbi:hypothetical protein DL769_006171 [Monosporascus sp. CRB-8-3]|nr:hypothetical protein DL769_006171 [Monosporascus sp. CRB-8-3]
MRPASPSGASTSPTGTINPTTVAVPIVVDQDEPTLEPDPNSLYHDHTSVTYHDNYYLSSTYAQQESSDVEKKTGGGGGNDDNDNHDGDAGAVEENDDNDHEMDDIGDVVSDVNYTTEFDMDLTALPNIHYDNQSIESEAVEHATLEPLVAAALPFSVPTSMIHQLPPPGPALALLNGDHNETLVQLQQQLQDAEDALNDGELNSNHPMVLNNPNPMSLGPENPGVVDFLRHWVWQSQRSIHRGIRRTPCWPQVREMIKHTPRRVLYGELNGDEYDFQGIDWKMLGITRDLARRRRLDIYCNYVNKKDSDVWLMTYPDRSLRTSSSYFRFKRMELRNDVRLLHFQLRNIFGHAPQSRAFYPGYGAVQELNLITGANKVAMAFDNDTEAQVSTLTVSHDILLVGGFYGDYRYRCLDTADSDPTEGCLTDNISGITNHVQIHSSRYSSAPLAAFASNDFGFRIVDLTTNKTTTESMYDYAMNCSALSPDGRLRVMVGDIENVLITDAENGEILQQLEGHRDFGFACDWAADGWTVATGNQDKTIRLWDARKWRNNSGQSKPIAVIRTEMSGARSLRFSPLGSGKRVLVAAEEADFIHAIDAQTLRTKQTFDIFGELGGISFGNDGQDLMVLSCDHHRGGVLQLERCDAGAEDTFDYTSRRYRDSPDWWRTPGYDWMQNPEQIVDLPGSQHMLAQRRRKAAMMDNLDPF